MSTELIHPDRGLTGAYPEANLRHYSFMLEGLRDVGAALEKRGIGFVLQHGDPAEVALKLGRRASLLVCDRGYLRPQKEWRRWVTAKSSCRVVQVESDVVVPVNIASDKREFAARTLRPKLARLWPEYLRAVPHIPLKKKSVDLMPSGLDWHNPAKTEARSLRRGSDRIFPWRNRRGAEDLSPFLH